MAAWLALLLFLVGYGFVITEEKTGMRKSTPMVLAAALIWLLLGISSPNREALEPLVQRALLEFGELFLFLLSAMTFVNTLEERGLFGKIRQTLLQKSLNYRQLYWVCGLLAFFISPVFDNLTTALLVGSIVMAVGQGQPNFQARSAISVVIAANAGGAFSPFGDITTLMVWQKGLVGFLSCFKLFLPSLCNWLLPAAWIARGLRGQEVPPVDCQIAPLKPGTGFIVVLFLLTIASAVGFHMLLHLPPVLGMLGGLAALELYGQYLARRLASSHFVDQPEECYAPSACESPDVFAQLQRSEWDTLLFFGGIILCMAGLDGFGWLHWAAQATYGSIGPTLSNLGVGLVSAVLDNIPVMAAVLTMEPSMSENQWLLICLCAGVGGSLLSVGSAAGVALMGQMRGIYTFTAHLRLTPVILLGYLASVALHLWLNP